MDAPIIDGDKPFPMSPEQQSLSDAIQLNLRTLVEQKPLTPQALLQIEQIAGLARRMLGIGKNPRAFSPSPSANYIMPGDIVGSDNYTSYLTPLPASQALAPSSPAETFGASFIREMVAAVSQITKPAPTLALPPLGPSIAELVFAVETARTKGMTDLAEKIEARLIERLSADAEPPASEPAETTAPKEVAA